MLKIEKHIFVWKQNVFFVFNGFYFNLQVQIDNTEC